MRRQARCLRCNKKIKSYSILRKWCFDCRRIVNLEYIKNKRNKKI